MMRQRVTSQTGGSGSDQSNIDNTHNTATASSASTTASRPTAARRRRQLSSSSPSHHHESTTNQAEGEEDSFVGLSSSAAAARAWSSEDLTSYPYQSSQQPKDGLTKRIGGPASPPGSGGLLVESSTISSSSQHQQQQKPYRRGSNSLQQQQQQQPPQTSSSHLRLQQQQSAPPSLEHVHVLYRTALHVPDSRYGEFIKGQSTRRKQSFVLSSHCCAHVCIGFSAVAMVFLLWVGLMFDTQPLYIKGALPLEQMHDQDTGKIIYFYKIPAAEEQLQAATSAYRAAVAYFLCILGSYHVLYPNWIKSKFYRFRRGYQDLDDVVMNNKKHDGQDHHHHHHENNIANNNNNSNTNGGGELPMYHADASAYSATTSLWNRAVLNGRQWLAARGWYKPGGGQRRLPNTKTV